MGALERERAWPVFVVQDANTELQDARYSLHVLIECIDSTQRAS